MPDPALSGLSILLLEDDTLLRKQIASQLERAGADVSPAATVEAARRWLHDLSFDFALLDVNLPDGLGTDLLQEKLFPANTAVIIITAGGGITGAVEAMRLGALDYLVKPFEPGELPLVLQRAQRARQSARLEEHNRHDADRTSQTFFFGDSLLPLQQQLEKILAADARLQSALPPALIQGETGTGKTTLARLLHHRGPRAQLPLVELNCSALPEALAESELFGHEKGAFTDARTARIGLFEAAHGGTLFLDELPSLSPALQAKVLKTVEDHRIRRLGGNRDIPVDVRLIAATHRDLQELVQEGLFREDLYHRLDLFRLQIPPLRQRGQDSLHLAQLLLKQLCRRHRLGQKKLSHTAKQQILSYPWPGNVRELAHELERAIVFEESDSIQLNLPTPGSQTQTSLPSNDWFNPAFVFPSQGFLMEHAVLRLIQHALKQTNNNVSAAARLLGVSRDYIRYHLDHGGKPPGSNP